MSIPQTVPIRRFKVLALWFFVVFFLLFLGIGLYRSLEQQRDSGAAPDFVLEIYDGDPIRLSDLRGNVVMVDVWASWCIPCRDEATDLETLWQSYKDLEFVLLGVAYTDTDRGAKEFIDEYGITYPNGPDIGLEISDTYGLQGVPEKYLIDKNGEIHKVFIGPASIAEYRAEIDLLLGK